MCTTRSSISRTKLAGCIAIVLSSGYSVSALSATTPLTGTVTTDKSGTSFTTNQLRVTTGGTAGVKGEQNEVTTGGTLTIDGGGTVLGGMDLTGAQVVAGITGAGKITQEGPLDIIDLSGGSTVDLDNATVTGTGGGFAINNGKLTTSKNTVIDLRGARAAGVGVANGISLTKNEPGAVDRLARINGSAIFVDEAGIALDCSGAQGSCDVIATDAHVEGGRVGILQAGGSSAIHGGAVIGTGSDTDNLPGTGAGYLLYSEGGSSSTTIDQGAVVTGQAGAGLQILNGDLISSSSANPVAVNINSGATIQGNDGLRIDTGLSSSAVPTTRKVAIVNINDANVKGLKGATFAVTDGTADITATGNSSLTSSTGVLLDTKSGGAANLTLSGVTSPVTGDIVNTGGTSNVSLLNSTLNGKMAQATSLTLGTGGIWNMTGDSSIGNISNAGTLSLGQGSTPGHTLTVTGNYTGNNGNLLLNTALGKDDSATDKLVIKGNASGTTNVEVKNAGGSGAQTIDGIEIIHVDGAVTPGAFKQKGRIVAGAYDYALQQNGNSVTLNSHLTDQNPFVVVQPVIRPEAGSYMANMAASSMFQTTLHERAGENRYTNVVDNKGNVTSLWLRQVGSHNQFHDGSGQLRTTGNTYVAQLGGDLAQWSSSDSDRFHLGVMAGYGNNSNNTVSTVSGHHSKGSVDGYSLGVYGTWYQNDADMTGAYIDGQLMYNWFNNHVSGDNISGEKYRSQGLLASVESGYTFAMGQFGTADNPTSFFLEPQAQVTWNGVKADDLTESNGSRVSSKGSDNVQTRLGTRAFLRGHNKMDNGLNRSFQPFVEVNWLHNTKRYGATMNGVSLEQAGATNVGEVKLGVEGQLSRNVQLWGGVGQQIGSEGYSNTTAMLGARYSFK